MDPKSHIALPNSNSRGRELLEMFTPKELEALLKIDVKTIYDYAKRGLIPCVRIQTNVRFPKQQIFDWIGEHNFRPRPINGNGANKR